MSLARLATILAIFCASRIFWEGTSFAGIVSRQRTTSPAQLRSSQWVGQWPLKDAPEKHANDFSLDLGKQRDAWFKLDKWYGGKMTNQQFKATLDETQQDYLFEYLESHYGGNYGLLEAMFDVFGQDAEDYQDENDQGYAYS